MHVNKNIENLNFFDKEYKRQYIQNNTDFLPPCALMMATTL